MTMMRAMLCRKWGAPRDLAFESIEAPEPGPGQVRLIVRAAGVNFADTLIVAGKYQVKPDFPFSPGLEVAGEIEAVGADVRSVRPGDRVMGVMDYGGYADRAVTGSDRVFPIPDEMDYTTAAAFPVAYGTSHVALTRRARLARGETLVVHGAAGGVGLTAVEIGKAMGARVIATARGTGKLAVAREHGADETIDYAEEDIRERVLELTDGKGADVIYDPVGGDVFDASLRCVGWEGRIVVIGFASGRIPEAPVNRLMVKNFTVTGVYWGAYLQRDPGVIRRSFGELLAWFGEGRLRPHVSHRFPLAEAPVAMETLLSRRSTGKVVLTMDES